MCAIFYSTRRHPCKLVTELVFFKKMGITQSRTELSLAGLELNWSAESDISYNETYGEKQVQTIIQYLRLNHIVVEK